MLRVRTGRRRRTARPSLPGRPGRLSAAAAARWRSERLSFEATDWDPTALLGEPPPALEGWHRLYRQRTLAPEQWSAAGRALLGWQLQLGSGLHVRTDADPVTPGCVAVLRIGPLRAPVRVLQVRREDDLVGFCYATLPGHPESGAEAFWIERRGAGVGAHVGALSRGGAWFTRAAGPVSRLAQQLAADRYLAVLAAVGPAR